jgi:predicted ATPase with chaperone activity
MSLAPAATEPGADETRPPAPRDLSETGLSNETVIDLLLKTLFVQGARSGQQLTDSVRLPFDIVDDQLLWLQERRFVEVRRTHGPSRGSYVFDLSAAGRDRARDALEASQYVGPAPVPLAAYREWVEAQSVRHLHVSRERIRAGFSHLVLPESLMEALGPAINSAGSIFLYGDPGNGKTVISEAIATLMRGDLYIPYAVDIEGQIMMLFDPVHHRVLEEEIPESETLTSPTWLRAMGDFDRRFVRIKRPVVFVGGELSLNQLDLQFDAFTKIYQAPFQLKAAGGVLIIDDFGRQLVSPRDLLNRWIVPLEKRVDYLTLHTGVKFPVPFDSLLIFATNLNPHDLVDEAFLRRIQYKVNVDDPERAHYEEIFRRECESRGINYLPHAIDHIYETFYRVKGIPPRACHPRDIILQVANIARYEGRPAELTDEVLDRACRSYFLVMAHQAMAQEQHRYPWEEK